MNNNKGHALMALKKKGPNEHASAQAFASTSKLKAANAFTPALNNLTRPQGLPKVPQMEKKPLDPIKATSKFKQYGDKGYVPSNGKGVGN